MSWMEWAARPDHMGGFPRKAVIMAAAAFAKTVANILNTTTVHNPQTLLSLVRNRPPNLPLVTVSNHVSTLDDPVIWGFKGFPTANAKLERWTLAAEDICFRNKFLGYSFRVGKCIPIKRGGGIYQEYMNEAVGRLDSGEWLHTFPEGKVCQENGPIRRLKWGTASLIVRAKVKPVVLPVFHQGLEEVMPENYLFGKRRPFLPLCNKKIRIIVGDPIELDLPKLREMAVLAAKNNKDSFSSSFGWSTCRGLNEVEQKYLYSIISERIRTVLENMRVFCKEKFETRG